MNYIAITISPGKQIDCQELCGHIQNLITKHSQQSTGPFEKVLVIQLKDIIDPSEIPKLEDKNS